MVFEALIANMQEKFVNQQVSQDCPKRELAPYALSPVGQMNTWIASVIVLRTGLSLSHVAMLYGVDKPTMGRWFEDWMHWGARFFAWLIPMPRPEVIRKMTDPAFYDTVKCNDIYFIADGVEIECQDSRGSSGLSGILQSPNKRVPTVKLIHVITTSGMTVMVITFILCSNNHILTYL
jgi:hypothetical protein